MNAEDMDDDEALQAAIRASLGESPAEKGNTSSVVDLTNDTDSNSDLQEVFPKSNSVVGSDTDNEAPQDCDDESDEDLKQAIAMSMAPSTDKTPVADAPSPEKPKPAGISGISRLDRQKMEEERLARQTKRKAEESISPAGRATSKALKVDQAFGRHTEEVISRAGTTRSPSQVGFTTRQPSVDPGIHFPLGVVKKTRVASAPRMGDDIKIEEVIQRSGLKYALFSSFLWEPYWLYPKIDMNSTNLMFVMSAKEESLRQTLLNDTRDTKNLKLCFPPMDGQSNCMHSKLMLLFHAEYLRIAVPTANLTSVDWGESNLMENTVFLIDLPRKTNTSEKNSTSFYDNLVEFMKASTFPQKLIDRVGTYDFSETERYAFVHSIGGSSNLNDESWKRTGYCGLGRAITQLGLQSFSPINIDFVTSSVGSLNEEFLRAIYLACKGDDGMIDYEIRNTKAPKNAPANRHLNAIIQAGKEWQDRFKVYFPSNRTAHAAHPNPKNTAGTISFQQRWWKGPKFPKHVMRDCESKRGVLMHNKLIFVWPDEPILVKDNKECQGWAYVGSANLSESAWGRLVKDRGTGKPKMNCRNWECGVLVPVIKQKTTSEAKYLPEAVFNDTIPVPMKIPATSLSDQRPPWFFMGD